jgi:quercetin dioxygenase-like cupin family protein
MPEVIKLIDSIEYQKDSVVSKTIIKQNTGNVTIFAFDEGQGLSEHTAPFDALVYIIDGEVKITIAGEDNLLKQGEMIIMPVNKPHTLKAVKKFKMMLVMIKS